ncbi:unnamed protein product [Linum trigynum]|uniref:Uncharacterized protein n=1 Tax=Linum trigynum TaxID=586398 RepID=A0AAV2GSS9_9ROSI
MGSNPSHYIAFLLSPILYLPASSTTAKATSAGGSMWLTRIKLLRRRTPSPLATSTGSSPIKVSHLPLFLLLNSDLISSFPAYCGSKFNLVLSIFLKPISRGDERIVGEEAGKA